jgi:ABC-type multidrug transport system permease subunit
MKTTRTTLIITAVVMMLTHPSEFFVVGMSIYFVISLAVSCPFFWLAKAEPSKLRNTDYVQDDSWC